MSRHGDPETSRLFRSFGYKIGKGDPKGEPIQLYPEDMEALEKRLKQLEADVQRHQELIDELGKKKP